MNKLIIRFPDQSTSFTYGVEFGRLLEKMERGDDVVMNNGFPIRKENVAVIKNTCAHYGYIPLFGKEYDNEWIEFTGIKQSTNN
jgi:hypothetical protein